MWVVLILLHLVAGNPSIFPSITVAASSNESSSEIAVDLSPFIREYKDGRIERLQGTDVVPASIDPETGSQSKDIVIAHETNLSARIYLPKNADSGKKLPILVYYHGGGFVVESPFSPLYHRHLNFLVSVSNVVAVSVNYSLPPEQPLPTAYGDSWTALKWIFSDSNAEEWIKEYGDLSRVYLGGDSAGGNIVHNVALRVGLENRDSEVHLSGIFLNCPYFYGKHPIGDELTHPGFSKSFLDKLWKFVYPGTTGSDDPRINPGMDPDLWRLGSKRVIIFVAGRDVFRRRSLLYEKNLRNSGWGGEIEVIDDFKLEDHVFSVISPTGKKGMEMLKKVASFINMY